jgi:carbamoylphosphate synthase large subunit
MFKVLLTCVGGELSPQLIKELKCNSRHKIKVIGVDVNANALGRHFCDAFYTVPFGNDSAYVSRIEQLVILNDVNLVIPTSDEEAVALSSSRQQIEKNGCQLASVDLDVLKILSDKAKTYQYLKSHGVHVPNTVIVKNFKSLKKSVNLFYKKYGSVVVKPSCARGGRGVYIIKSDASVAEYFDDKREIHCDLNTFFDNLICNLKDEDSFIVMEKLIEPVFDIDLLAWEGVSKRIISRKRVNSAVPNDGHIIINDKLLSDLGEKLINIFRLSWLYDCDVMFDSSGNPCVLELNPRQSGSIAVTIAAGVPMLDDLISLSKGEDILDIRLPINKRVIPFKSLAVFDK